VTEPTAPPAPGNGAPTAVADPPATAPGSGAGDGGTAGDGTGGEVPRRPRRIFLLVGLVLAAGLAVGLFTGVGTKSGSTSAGGPPHPGSAAPSFTLSRLGGPGQVGTPSDGGGNGRPAILLFFASWCPPCTSEIPALAAAYRQDRASGGPLSKVAVLGVDGSDPKTAATAFVKGAGVTFPVAVDGSFQVTEGLYWFNGDPGAVAITADGRIAHIVHGPISADTMAAWARELTAAK